MKTFHYMLAAALALSATAFAASNREEVRAATEALQAGDTVKAFKHWEKAAKAGDAVAQYNLSVAYSNGDGVAADEAQALAWLKKSAAQRYQPAQIDLAAWHLRHGQYADAAAIFKQLADIGHPLAQFNYGIMLGRGDGFPAPREMEGLEWIRKSAAQGFPPAEEFLRELEAQKARRKQ
ncbi:MAG: hypothetical protein Q4D61_03435 [Cardiobacteriaceae bacterium]|nr:hypothetical protein [Cardiobacteriaceae bacterium]